MTGSSAVGVGSPFENGNTSFFVDVPTSNTFFRLLCLTERIFTAAPQLPVEGTRCFQFFEPVEDDLDLRRCRSRGLGLSGGDNAQNPAIRHHVIVPLGGLAKVRCIPAA